MPSLCSGELEPAPARLPRPGGGGGAQGVAHPPLQRDSYPVHGPPPRHRLSRSSRRGAARRGEAGARPRHPQGRRRDGGPGVGRGGRECSPSSARRPPRTDRRCPPARQRRSLAAAPARPRQFLSRSVLAGVGHLFPSPLVWGREPDRAWPLLLQQPAGLSLLLTPGQCCPLPQWTRLAGGPVDGPALILPAAGGRYGSPAANPLPCAAVSCPHRRGLRPGQPGQELRCRTRQSFCQDRRGLPARPPPPLRR